MHDGVATELTDGYAFGVTVLMALTGLPAAGIKQRCRHMLKWPTQPQRWQPPGVPDVAAGSWDGGASSGLAEVAQGLDRLTILRDAARALVHLHAQQPVLLHGDVAAPSE